MRFAAGSTGDAAAIEQLGLDFGIATGRTSWVAVSDVATVDPTLPTRRTEVPQMLPVGLSAFGLGLTDDLGTMFGKGPELLGADVQVLSLGATRLRLGMRGAPFSFRRAVSRSFGDRVAGRVVLATASRLVVEFAVGATALVWRPEARAVVAIASHGFRVASLSAEEGTAPGRIEPGRTVRVVLKLDQELPAPPESLTIDLDGGRLLMIVIEAA
jgi:hypothetical protein